MESECIVQLNGKAHSLPSGSTVLSLLQNLGMAEIPVLVEHNTTALFPREFLTTNLGAGDHVEIIRIVAGG